MAVVEEARYHLSEIVDRVSYNFVFGQSKKETLDNELEKFEDHNPSIRNRLAILFHLLQNDKWGILDEELADLIEDDEDTNTPPKFDIKDTTTIKILVQIQADLPKLISLDKSNSEAIDDLRKQIRIDYAPQDEDDQVRLCVLDAWMKMFESYEEGKHQNVLTKLPFSKQSCCNKLTKWIRKYMVGVGEALVTSEQTSIDELRKARSLLSDQVDDPLEEARKIASQATTTKAITHDKQAAENRLKDSDVTNIGEEPAEPSFHLTSVPPPPNFPSKDPKSPVLKPPEGIAPRKKKAWTAEEKNAIKSGIKKLAKGRWADIKEEYSEILADRTSVMIKDCYRTMVASGEIVEEEGIGEEPEEVEKTAEKVVTMSESEFVGAEKRGQKRGLDEQSELYGR